jgi:hypothetical protein
VEDDLVREVLEVPVSGAEDIVAAHQPHMVHQASAEAAAAVLEITTGGRYSAKQKYSSSDLSSGMYCLVK